MKKSGRNYTAAFKAKVVIAAMRREKTPSTLASHPMLRKSYVGRTLPAAVVEMARKLQLSREAAVVSHGL